MESKVIHFYNGKALPGLSHLMIIALVEAYVKQQQKIPFGPGDINGSFMALVNRGLVVRKEVTIRSNTEMMWQLTSQAIKILNEMGIDVSE